MFTSHREICKENGDILNCCINKTLLCLNLEEGKRRFENLVSN